MQEFLLGILHRFMSRSVTQVLKTTQMLLLIMLGFICLPVAQILDAQH
jgi:hypothetical protein